MMVADGGSRAGLAAVVAEFVDEIGRQPTLGELLEIVAMSVPTVGPRVDGLAGPVALPAKVSGGPSAGWRRKTLAC